MMMNIQFLIKKKIKSFFNKTFDAHLGWNWKPNTKHEEKIFLKNQQNFFWCSGRKKKY